MPQNCRGCEAFKSSTRCANESFFSQPTLSLKLFEHPPSQDGNCVCINMVDTKIDIATYSRYYSSSKSSTSLEAPPPPPKTNLQIEKPEPLPHISKGVFKCSTHNPNARATQNYSIVEDLGQTPCVNVYFGGTPDVSIIEECLTLCLRSSRT
jgi:hypothetical protein